MTPDTTALKELLGKVEAGGDVYGFGALGSGTVRGFGEAACSGSMDAALRLMEAVLPGWGMSVFGGYVRKSWGATVGRFDPYRVTFGGTSVSPARALLIAILKALIAEGGDHE